MAAITVTAANVIPASGAVFETAYLAGATLTRGKSVYLDTATTPPTWKLADADLSAIGAGSGGVGISCSDCASGQPCIIFLSGTIAFGSGVLTNGELYFVGATAGDIVPDGDLTTTWRVTLLGVASGTSNLVCKPWATGITL